MNKKILVITEKTNDLVWVLKQNLIPLDMILPDQVHKTDLDAYHSIMILGGNNVDPMEIYPKDRKLIDQKITEGKKVFCEYCQSLYTVSFLESLSTRYARPVVLSGLPGADLSPGDILDEQSNNRMRGYKSAYNGLPVLQYMENPTGFYKTDVDFVKDIKKHQNALWFERENLLVCSFRMVNFIEAKFSPKGKWCGLIKTLLEWVTDQKVDMTVTRQKYEKAYHFEQNRLPFVDQCKKAVDHAFDWFEKNDMYDHSHGGYNSVREGYGTAVYADGTHKKENTVRLDNTGEMSYAWLMRYLLTGEQKCLDISHSLTDYVLDLQVKEDGPFYGMVRNGPGAWWNICYQDDSARGFLLPKLFEMLYTKSTRYKMPVKECLDFLVRTTGKDGLRVSRTDYVSPYQKDVTARAYKTVEDNGIIRYTTDGEIIKDVTYLSQTDGNLPSGHYNGYYLASLFLAYKIYGDKIYLDTAKKGMDKIKSVYPFTSREHSQTQELCRLILPCAMQYYATREDADKEFLYEVTKDLQQFRHESGAYLEWDTGYTAHRGGTKGTECSVLCKNGDPVTDMLYSLNWLPVGFIQSYLVTGDPYFKDLWEDIVKFFLKTQIKSENKCIDGAWARAYDVNLKEIYGVPNDIGWAPWSIETGWTVGEIIIGIQQGMLFDSLKMFYN